MKAKDMKIGEWYHIEGYGEVLVSSISSALVRFSKTVILKEYDSIKNYFGFINLGTYVVTSISNLKFAKIYPSKIRNSPLWKALNG